MHMQTSISLQYTYVVLYLMHKNYLAVNSKPSTKHLLPYVAHIALNWPWYEVGAMLLEVEQESQLEVIRATYDHNVSKCCLD